MRYVIMVFVKTISAFSVGLTTNLSQLEGLALVDRSSTPEVISHFPVSSMPQDIHERFSYLFETRERWTLDEIRPYVM